jgi:hypothetical protein
MQITKQITRNGCSFQSLRIASIYPQRTDRTKPSISLRKTDLFLSNMEKTRKKMSFYRAIPPMNYQRLDAGSSISTRALLPYKHISYNRVATWHTFCSIGFCQQCVYSQDNRLVPYDRRYKDAFNHNSRTSMYAALEDGQCVRNTVILQKE